MRSMPVLGTISTRQDTYIPHIYMYMARIWSIMKEFTWPLDPAWLVTHYLFYNTGYDPLIPWPAVQGEQLSSIRSIRHKSV